MYARLICTFGFAVKDEELEVGAGAICNPSELPGGVSSAADADADAEAEGEIPSCRLPSYLLFFVNGFGNEAVEVTELADAVIDGFF